MTIYSVRGNIRIVDESNVVLIEETLQPWGHTTARLNEDGYNIFAFEVWVTTEEYKSSVFEQLKPLTTSPNDWIDWHVCSHGEQSSQPCTIVETYRGG